MREYLSRLWEGVNLERGEFFVFVVGGSLMYLLLWSSLRIICSCWAIIVTFS